MPRSWDWWTEQKLDILADYLAGFTRASKKAGTTVYLDLFAGRPDNVSRDRDERQIHGSARRALDTRPPLSVLRFFELDATARKLDNALRTAYPGRVKDFRVVPGDCKHDHCRGPGRFGGPELGADVRVPGPAVDRGAVADHRAPRPAQAGRHVEDRAVAALRERAASARPAAADRGHRRLCRREDDQDVRHRHLARGAPGHPREHPDRGPVPQRANQPDANFADSAARTVGSIDTEGIWQLIQAAQVSGHGTTLVLSSSPAEEAARLGGQAVAIEPGSLEPADIVRLGNIDGAVVLGPDGRCYAFGVILDGTASGRGDPARGSRFNSAIRYQDSMAPNSLLVVISDDGTVDLVPQLRHRVNRNDVEAAVRTFCERCEDNPVNGEEFARTHDRVKALVFYLDDAQCQLVNDAYTNEMRRRFEAGGISITEAPLRPHPDMNDSYFIQR